MANTRRDFLQQAATVAVGSYVGIHSSPAVPMLSAAEPPAVDETPELAALRIVELSEEHIAAVKRRRRIYVNNDAGYGAPMGPTISAITPAEWIEARFSAFTQSGSQVDCVGWCLDEGNIAAYPSKVLPELQYPTLLKWRKEGVDLVKLIIEESQRRKIEAFWEFRINGADREADISTPARIALKDQHPEWLVEGGWWGPGLWNYAIPEVRAHIVAILRELAENYDLDGINLDFGRHPPFLPIGRQWEHRDALTDFVRQVRLKLQEVAKQRGRPFLLSVRVADTVPGCHFDGMDVETWVRQNLVDMIVIGTRSIQVDLSGFREITKGSHIKLYPCIDQHHSPDGYHSLGIEQLRGLAANWRHQGADGVATFNFWNELPEMASRLVGVAYGDSESRRALQRMAGGESVHAQAYREMGDLKGLALLDKWFVVSRRYGGGWDDRWNSYLNMNHQAPLPLTISPEPAWVEIYVADEVAACADRVQSLRLRLQISGGPDPQSVLVKFNGIELRNPAVEADWWVYKLQPQQMAVGRNLLTIRHPVPAGVKPITIEKVEVHVTYRSANHGK